MASLINNIDQLNTDMQSIKAKIIELGAEMPEGTTTSEWANLIQGMYDMTNSEKVGIWKPNTKYKTEAFVIATIYHNSSYETAILYCLKDHTSPDIDYPNIAEDFAECWSSFTLYSKRDGMNNIIHDTYATKEELQNIGGGGSLDLTNYISKDEVDATPTASSTNPVSSGGVYDAIGELEEKTTIRYSSEEYLEENPASIIFSLNEIDNTKYIVDTDSVEIIEFDIPEDVYQLTHISEIEFYSGESPMSISYTNSGIIQWDGTDCSITSYSDDEGIERQVSIFAPQANTYYDIVIWFSLRARCFVGLVKGFKTATTNTVE